jgi:hypothetical protein
MDERGVDRLSFSSMNGNGMRCSMDVIPKGSCSEASTLLEMNKMPSA